MSRFSVVDGDNITVDDIAEGVALDRIVYDEEYYVTIKQCMEWYNRNSKIYTMLRDEESKQIIAYVNMSPLTEEYYQKIRSGKFIDTYLPAEAIVDYEIPDLYYMYFSSIVVHPDYQNTEVFMSLFNAVTEKFIKLGEQGILIKSIVADAVSEKGEKFCHMFGMKEVKSSTHESKIYEVQMMPPEFRVSSKATKRLRDYYTEKAQELGDGIQKESMNNDITNGTVFISRSEKDALIAEKVCDYLESNGIKCWIASRDAAKGKPFATQIVQEIRSCIAMVLVASESTNESGHVSNEVSLAFDNKKLIVPFKVEKFTFSDEFLYFLNRNVWIEAHDNMDKGLDELISTLLNRLSVKGKTAAPKEKPKPEKTVDPREKEVRNTCDDVNISKDEIADIIQKKSKKFCNSSMRLFSEDNNFNEVKAAADAFLKQSFVISKGSREVEADSRIDYLIEELTKDSAPGIIKVLGRPGSAKSALLQTAFFEIFSSFKNGRTNVVPYYISLSYYEKYYDGKEISEEQIATDIADELSEYITFIQNERNVVPLVFVDGVREHSMGVVSLDNILAHIFENAHVLKRVVSIDTGVIKNRSRLRRVIPLATGRVRATFTAQPVDMHIENNAKLFISNLIDFNNYDIEADRIFDILKQLKYHEIDAFTVTSIAEEIINDSYELVNISELYDRWALTVFHGDENQLEEAAKNTFAYVFDIDYEIEATSFTHPQWRLINKHRSFLDMLVVKKMISELKEYEEGMTFDVAFFDIMLTSSADRFVKKYLIDDYETQEKILSLVTELYDSMSAIQKGTAAIWLSKLSFKNLIAEVKEFLEPKYAELVPVVKKTDNTTQDNYDNQFVFRSICFTLIQLGQMQVQDDYLCLLITNDSAHAINRGAFVEFFSDKHQIADNDTYCLDTDIEAGSKAINALIWRVNKKLRPGGKYPEFDLVTLASLLQTRIQTNKSESIAELRGWVKEFLSALKKYKVLPQHIKSEKIQYYFRSMKDDFELFLESVEDFDISQIMYSTLQNLKETKRKQWTRKNIYDPESISEHAYSSWMLAMLFLPQETNYPEYSKKEILDMLMIHDMAEACLGDIVTELNEPSIELKNQNEILRKLFVKGSYPNIANLTYYYNIWTGYYKGLNINSKVARDVNLIQTVYTFCEYYLRYPENFDASDLSQWRYEKEKLETDIGFSVYEKLIGNNRRFAGALSGEYAETETNNRKKPSSKTSPAKKEVKPKSTDYEVLGYTQLQSSDVNIDNIKKEIIAILNSVTPQSVSEAEVNLEMLEYISENWRIILNNENQVVGYWVFVALPDEMAALAKEGKLKEKYINTDSMEYIDFPGTYNGYILMAGTKPEARTAALVRLLYESLLKHVEDLAQKGVFFREILCVGESTSGQSAIKKIGFKEISEHVNGGKVLSLDMTNVLENKYLSSMKNLTYLYREYFKNEF